MRVHVVDFETHRIESRPAYPPEPVGVSVKLASDRKPRYLAWGHPVGNNTTRREATRFLEKVWRDDTPLVFHNAKFDLAVGSEKLGLPYPAWDRVHDTMFLAFLSNPHARKLDLKSLAADLLDEPPTERDELHDWIVANVWTSKKSGAGSVVVSDRRPDGFFKVPPSKAGAFIAYGPGSLVGRYADGDVTRTARLFRRLYDEIRRRGMSPAYDRERRLVAALDRSERAGVSVRYRALKADLGRWERSLDEVDAWIRKRLRAPDVSIDSADELADAIENAGAVGEWVLTPSGKRSTSKENLVESITDTALVEVLGYRGLLVNSLRNFGRPWLRMADASGGRIFTNWNQVRTPEEKGARTGRLSSNPNFQNISKKPPVIVTSLAEARRIRDGGDKAFAIPATLRKRICDLPYMRGYIAPRKGHVLINRDYSQQELRILGHYEDGVLLDAYVDDPTLDLHTFAQRLINEMLSANFPRKPIKNMGFGLIYGMGIAKLAVQMGVDFATAKTLKRAYLQIFPGLKRLIDHLMEAGRAGEPIHTWGGRAYYVEPPRYSKKLRKLQTFEYKLLNVLIQGSAADCTKEAAIRVDEACRESRFLMTVHDELMLDAPAGAYKEEMARMRDAMESVEFDVPMLSDGKWGRTSWGTMRKFREPSWAEPRRRNTR